MCEKHIPGIAFVDPQEQILISCYRDQAGGDEASQVLVAEIINSRLPHTKIEKGHPEGRLAVFGRWISEAKRQDRTAQYEADPEGYLRQIYEETRNVIVQVN